MVVRYNKCKSTYQKVILLEGSSSRMFLGGRKHYIKGYEQRNGKVEKYFIWSVSTIEVSPLKRQVIRSGSLP